MENMAMRKPGVRMRDLSLNGDKLEDKYKKGKYGFLMCGVALCDQWSLIAYRDKLVQRAFDYEIEASMVQCVEALLSPEGGDFSIKLESKFW